MNGTRGHLWIRRDRLKTMLAMESQGINSLDIDGNTKKQRAHGKKMSPWSRHRPPPRACRSKRGLGKETRQRDVSLQKKAMGRRLPDDPSSRRSRILKGEEAALVDEEVHGPLDTPLAKQQRRAAVARMQRREHTGRRPGKLIVTAYWLLVTGCNLPGFRL